MAERKIFAGARLKRLRQRLGLSQTQMASELGLSPSYLNLIERNQRPLTVQVLIKLSGVYGIDATELSGAEGADMVEALKEIFSDPLIAGEIASPVELAEMAEAAPNAARGVARLHAAWRESLERLSDLSHLMAREGEAPVDAASRLPHGQVAAYFETAAHYFPDLEAAAEELSGRLSPRDDPAQALKSHLRDAFGIETRILPVHVMPLEQARYDRHTQRFYLSERVPLAERPFLLARQIALLGESGLLDRLTGEARMAEAEAARICRMGFACRLAEAMLAPAARLAAATRELGADIGRLSDRFTLRPLRIMARLAALGGPGGGLPAAFMLVIDASGGVLSRLSGAGFPFPRFGPFCARLPLFDDLQPGRPASAELSLPDGGAFHAIAWAETGAGGVELPPPRRLAVLGWRREDAAPLLRERPHNPARPVGVTCRLCERLDCAHRMHPPVTRPAAFHEYVVGPSDYELIG